MFKSTGWFCRLKDLYGKHFGKVNNHYFNGFRNEAFLHFQFSHSTASLYISQFLLCKPPCWISLTVMPNNHPLAVKRFSNRLSKSRTDGVPVGVLPPLCFSKYWHFCRKQIQVLFLPNSTWQSWRFGGIQFHIIGKMYLPLNLKRCMSRRVVSIFNWYLQKSQSSNQYPVITKHFLTEMR